VRVRLSSFAYSLCSAEKEGSISDSQAFWPLRAHASDKASARNSEYGGSS
jgi:hypothetical protein